MSETTVGSIVGFLRLDNDQAMRALAQVDGAVDKLDTSRADVEVNADTADAEVGLARVAAEADAVDKKNVKLEDSLHKVSNKFSGLATAVLTLGPATVPAAAAAAGLGAAFGAMGASGIAALYGIKLEMEAGTRTGAAFADALDMAKGDIQDLSRVAASGVLRPLQESVNALHAAMPALSATVGDFASVTGKSAALGVQGLLAAFQALVPMMSTVAVYAYGLAQRFEGLMAGPGVVAFGAYVQSVFPQVMAAVESIAGAAVHLVQALAPLGMGTIGVLRMFADVINAIPVDVLAVLAQVASSAFVALKAWSALTGIIDAVGKSITITAGAMTVMNFAAGGVGIALGLLTMAFTVHAESQRRAEQAANDFADALRRSNGVIDESVRAVAVKQLQDQNATETARQLGISLQTLTDAALGQRDAMDQVAAAVERVRATNPDAVWGAEAAVVGEANANRLADAVTGANAALEAGAQKERDRVNAMGQAAGAEALQAQSLRNLALLHQGSASATDEDRKALQGLNSEMDKSISKALTLAQSQTAVDAALLNMTNTLRENKGRMDQHTQAGIANRQAIEGGVGALQRQRDAQIQAEGSTAAATITYSKHGQQMLDNIAKTTGANSAAYAYAKQLLQIPPSVQTQLTANAATASATVAAFAQQLSNLRDRTIYINTVTRAIQLDARAAYMDRISPADGGLIRAYASGGLEVHNAQIAPAGAMRVWAEPETGGEAYIPLAPVKRARSLAIWEETGRLLGAEQSGPSIENHFHVSGSSAEEIAARVTAIQAFQLASG